MINLRQQRPRGSGGDGNFSTLFPNERGSALLLLLLLLPFFPTGDDDSIFPPDQSVSHIHTQGPSDGCAQRANKAMSGAGGGRWNL